MIRIASHEETHGGNQILSVGLLLAKSDLLMVHGEFVGQEDFGEPIDWTALT